MTEYSLRSLKVVELAGFVSGPYAGKLLADFGAEVIKIEPPTGGDPARARGPFPGDKSNPEASGTYLYLNTGKRSVTLDIEAPEGRDLLKRLLVDVDIFIEDHGPDEMERLGLDFRTLAAQNPRLIVVSITPFGAAGPWAKYKAYYLNTYHASGQAGLLPGWAKSLDVPPVRGPGLIGDYDAGMAGATAALGALFWRDSRGQQGQHIEISKQHAMLHLERPQLRRYIDTGKSPDRTNKGRLLELVVQSKNGDYAVLILSSQKQWEGLFEVMGRPEWASKPPFDTQEGRAAAHLELCERLETWAKTKTVDEMFHGIQTAGSACAPITNAEAFHNSEQIRHRGYFNSICHPVAGKLDYPGNPYRLSTFEPVTREPAPLLGQHNEEVLCGSLGLSREALAKLKRAGVV